MGRGRAKAKQTKVARQLKYNSGGMDLERLRDELVHDDGGDGGDGATEAARRHRKRQDEHDCVTAHHHPRGSGL